MGPTYSRTQRSGPLTFKVKFYQGLGAIPDTVKNWVINTLVLFYYSQLLGLDAFQVSVILAVAMVFDADNGPDRRRLLLIICRVVGGAGIP